MPRPPEERHYSPEAREWVLYNDDDGENHYSLEDKAFYYLKIDDRMFSNHRAWWLGQVVDNMPYRSEEDAMKALSDVCIAWYRAKRGLKHVLKHYRQQFPMTESRNR